MTAMAGPATAPEQKPATPGPHGRRGAWRLGAWRVALRIAQREVRRAPGRSALVVLLVMLPVLVVVAGSTLIRSSMVSVVESIPREMGSADAAVFASGTPREPQLQCADLTCAMSTETLPAQYADLPPQEAISAALGPDARSIAMPSTDLRALVGDRSVEVQLTEAPLDDPMLVGMVDLVEGRIPAGPGEVAVSTDLRGKGAELDSIVAFAGVGAMTVVGVVDGPRGEAFAAPGSIADPGDVGLSIAGTNARILVTNPGGVGWDEVLALNQAGLTVLSGQLVTDPPSDAEIAADPRSAPLADVMTIGSPLPVSQETLAILLLLIVMVLLEVVLLAGPAFAVSAARQTRTLGMVAAQGGTARQLRRIVLAQAIVLGGLAVAAGVGLGLAVARVAYPYLPDAGPFEIGWIDIVGVVLFGLAAAVLAAVAPARAAARLEPVRAIAGRRPTSRVVRWHPILGLVLLGAGVGAAVLGATSLLGSGSGSLLIAVAAILAVFGAVLCVPIAIALLGRAARPAPLAARFALRDMARNQGRTAPAVAAVTAVVAGAVALGIAGMSDSAQGHAQYTTNGPTGAAVIQLVDDQGFPVGSGQLATIADTLAGALPGGTVTLVPAIPDAFMGITTDPTLMLTESDVLRPPLEGPTPVGSVQFESSGGWWYASPILVGADGLTAVASALTHAQLTTARTALTSGEVVVLRNRAGPDRGTARIDTVASIGPEGADPALIDSAVIPAIGLTLPGVGTPAVAIIPSAVAEDAAVAPAITQAVLSAERDLTVADQERLQAQLEAVPALSPSGVGAGVSVETGWHNDLAVVMLILGITAGLMVLAGSLTAALLALSDAQPDFATLGAVGAAPRLRRRIAGVYGWSIATVGALLGVLAGMVPGIAIAYPLTGDGSDGRYEGMVDLTSNPIAEHYLVFPWTMIGVLVIGLPILVALVIAASTRSRLPMTARIE